MLKIYPSIEVIVSHTNEKASSSFHGQKWFDPKKKTTAVCSEMGISLGLSFFINLKLRVLLYGYTHRGLERKSVGQLKAKDR